MLFEFCFVAPHAGEPTESGVRTVSGLFDQSRFMFSFILWLSVAVGFAWCGRNIFIAHGVLSRFGLVACHFSAFFVIEDCWLSEFIAVTVAMASVCCPLPKIAPTVMFAAASKPQTAVQLKSVGSTYCRAQ